MNLAITQKEVTNNHSGSAIRKSALPEMVPLDDLVNGAAGARIRAYRELSGWSQRFLAEKATSFLSDGYKVTQSDISRIEKNPGKSKFYILAAVCKALNFEIGTLNEDEMDTVGPDDDQDGEIATN